MKNCGGEDVVKQNCRASENSLFASACGLSESVKCSIPVRTNSDTSCGTVPAGQSPQNKHPSNQAKYARPPAPCKDLSSFVFFFTSGLACAHLMDTGMQQAQPIRKCLEKRTKDLGCMRVSRQHACAMVCSEENKGHKHLHTENVNQWFFAAATCKIMMCDICNARG